MAGNESRRPGRRAGASGTREAILAAAAARFTEQGFDRTTVRQVAADADVDPALVHHFFHGKEELFARAMSLPLDPEALVTGLLADGVDGLGPRLARRILAVVDEAGPANPMIGLIRSAATRPAAAAMLREFLTSAVLDRVAAAVHSDHPRLRAALCASQIMGLVFARDVVALDPLPTTAPDLLAAAYGPALQHYLTGPLG